jgi:hypothetical protein
MNSPAEPERNHGPQPFGERLAELGLSHHDVVAASAEQITHKMVAKAAKGRELSRRVQEKVARALNAASGQTFSVAELFTYRGRV